MKWWIQFLSVCVCVCLCEWVRISFFFYSRLNSMCHLSSSLNIFVCIFSPVNPLCLASRWQRNRTNTTGTITMRANWSVSCGWRAVCVCLCSWVCCGSLGFWCSSWSCSLSAVHTCLLSLKWTIDGGDLNWPQLVELFKDLPLKCLKGCLYAFMQWLYPRRNCHTCSI